MRANRSQREICMRRAFLSRAASAATQTCSCRRANSLHFLIKNRLPHLLRGILICRVSARGMPPTRRSKLILLACSPHNVVARQLESIAKRVAAKRFGPFVVVVGSHAGREFISSKQVSPDRLSAPILKTLSAGREGAF